MVLDSREARREKSSQARLNFASTSVEEGVIVDCGVIDLVKRKRYGCREVFCWKDNRSQDYEVMTE